MRALLYIIPIMLLSAVICYGSTDVSVTDTVRVVDTTPKSWWVTYNVPTIMLVIFTVVLAGATGYYAWQTRRHVDVSNDLLASNRELIELNKAQNDITKAQLLSSLYRLSHTRGWGEAGLVDRDLGPCIRIYLNRATGGLLGEPYERKVRVKLRDDHRGTRSLFHINCKPGEPVVIPLMLWEVFLEVTHDDTNFEFIEYVEPDQSSEQDNIT